MGLGGLLVRVAVRSAVRAAVSQPRAPYPPQMQPGFGPQAGYPQQGYGPPPGYPQQAFPQPGFAPYAAGPRAQSSGCGMAFLVLTAVGGLGLGVLSVLIGIGMMVSPNTPKDPQTGGSLIGIALVLFMMPGALALTGALWVSAKKKRLSRLAVLAQTNARLPLATVASELSVDQGTARKILFEAIEAGLVRGRLDIEQGTFFPEGVAQPQVYSFTGPCRSCGAPLSLTITPGIPAQCPFCRVGVA